MKILLINKFLYPKGGDAISTLTTGGLLKSKGHEVYFWGMKDSRNADFENSDLFIEHIDYDNTKGIKNKIRAATNMLYSFEAKSKLGKLLKRIRPDIVHLNNFAHQISPSILHEFKKLKIPVVMTMRDYKMVCPVYSLVVNDKLCQRCAHHKYYNCFLNKCKRNSYSKSMLNTIEMYLHHSIMKVYDLIDVYISPSRFLKDKVTEMGFKRKIEYLPNFVKVEDFEAKYDWVGKYIVYFGRVSHGKGIKTLIEAVKRLDVTLKIVGDGPTREELESEVNSSQSFQLTTHNSQLKTKTEFLGHTTGDELKDIIRNSMFVVVPSEWYENNPRSVIEAFALGKPVIGARIGGISELVKEGETGLTFEPKDYQDLREKISFLVDHPELIVKLGQNARSFAERELNAEKHYTRLMSVYNQAIKKTHYHEE